MVYSERDDLIDSSIELTLITSSLEEPSFYNTTVVTINVVETCPMTQSLVDDALIGRIEEVEVYAALNTPESVSIVEVVEEVRLALQVSEDGPCGAMEYALVTDDEWGENSPLSFSASKYSIELWPTTELHPPGIYEESYIHFYFLDRPDLLAVNVPMRVVIIDCNKLVLAQSKLVVQTLGAEATWIHLPALIISQKCGSDDPEIHRYELQPVYVPEGVELDEFISFDEDEITLTVLKTEDYTILNKSIYVSLLAIEESGRMANFTLMVSYDTEGPWIDEPILAPNITCSPLDTTWRLEMPAPALSDELSIDTELIQGDQFSNLFSFTNRTRTGVLKAEKLSELT